MNNKEAYEILNTKFTEARTIYREHEHLTHLLLEYENHMDDWKDSILTSRMTALKATALAGGVDLSTWDGSVAPVEEDED